MLGVWQQCTSGLGVTNQTCYELSGGCFTTYGFDYKPGFDKGYITWWNNNERAWTVYSDAMVADTEAEISVRPIPQEPMVRASPPYAECLQLTNGPIHFQQYIVMNVAISEGFGLVDVENLKFPGTMSVDYVRVYQPKGAINTGCDPKDFPTAAYIET